jgi:hypothetical protein
MCGLAGSALPHGTFGWSYAGFLFLSAAQANYQAWLALPAAEDKDFARRVRKGTGADATASGATRVAGSLNFKDKYAPVFPRVVIHTALAGRLTSAAELDGLGLVAEPETVAQPLRMAPARSRPGPGSRRWPSYERCVDGAPLNSEETGPDISRADFVWCMTAITWGWSTAETAERLMEESTKAQTNGRGYAPTSLPAMPPWSWSAAGSSHFEDTRRAEHGRKVVAGHVPYGL